MNFIRYMEQFLFSIIRFDVRHCATQVDGIGSMTHSQPIDLAFIWLITGIYITRQIEFCGIKRNHSVYFDNALLITQCRKIISMCRIFYWPLSTEQSRARASKRYLNAIWLILRTKYSFIHSKYDWKSANTPFKSAYRLWIAWRRRQNDGISLDVVVQCVCVFFFYRVKH